MRYKMFKDIEKCRSRRGSVLKAGCENGAKKRFVFFCILTIYQVGDKINDASIDKKYYYEQTGNKSNSICRACRKICAENALDIAFDASIFEGIIPKQNTDELLKDDTAKRYWIYSPYQQ